MRWVKTDAGGDEKLTFKFVWPYCMLSSMATCRSSSSWDRKSNCSSALLTIPSCFSTGCRDAVISALCLWKVSPTRSYLCSVLPTVLIDGAVKTDELSTYLAVEV